MFPTGGSSASPPITSDHGLASIDTPVQEGVTSSPPVNHSSDFSPAQNGSNTAGSGPTMGESILRKYAHSLDPLYTNDHTHTVHEDFAHCDRPTRVTEVVVIPTPIVTTPASLASTSATTGTATETATATTAASSFAGKRGTQPAPLKHRKNIRSIPNIPTQTILKAMASRSRLTGPATASLADHDFKGAFSSVEPNRSSDQLASTGMTLAVPDAVSHLKALSMSSPTNFLRSPCFLHQRFDSIVDMHKVVEEMSEDDYSHSRLMKTAVGVREVSKQLQRRPLKRAVRTVLIVTKARDNSLVYLTRDLAEWLLSTPRYGNDIGVDVYVDAKLKTSKRFDAKGLVAKEPRYRKMLKYWTPDLCYSDPEGFDLVLTLGGDGTVLYTSWLFQRIAPPVLCFSLGSLGFLTNFEFTQFKEYLDNVMGDAGMRINMRMRFTCTVWRADRSPGAEKGAVEEGEQFEVLNELVIDRGPSAYVSNIELYGDDQLLTVVQADGCIFSTPTGSTAYSLSAGGSLIHPSIPAILLTPICPHTLSFRPMVLSDTLALRIAIPAKSRSSAYCSFDGKGRIELKQGDYVTLEASQYPFPTVMSGGNEWVESVQRALKWNVRGAMQKGWDEGQEEDPVEDEKWDIDTDPVPNGGTDSGIGQSEDGDYNSASPLRKQVNLLNL